MVTLNRFDLAMLSFHLCLIPLRPVGEAESGCVVDTTREGISPQEGVTLSGRNVKVTQTVNDAPLPVAFETLNSSAPICTIIA